MTDSKFSRRDFIRLGTLTAAGALAAGCECPEEVPTSTPKPTNTPLPVSLYNESPMLASLVASGDLPEVDDRLPDNPMVIESLSGEQGDYSDELRVGFVGASPEWGIMLFLAQWEHPLSWTPDFGAYVPNLAESITANDEATEFTIKLRKGLKWSDGDDYNADDLMFYFDDVLFNPDISSEGPVADWLPTDMAADFAVEKIDNETVKLIFPSSYGTFLYNIAGWGGRYFSMYPRHYLEQFHASYNEDVQDLVDDDPDAADWVALFFKLGPDNWANPGRWCQYPELPALWPWVTTQPLEGGTQTRLERNPYYHKVDEQGNQLPYFDQVLGISYQEDEARTLAMLNGDIQYVKDPGGENRVLYHDAMDDGKPIMIKYPVSEGANTNTIHFNQTIDDDVKAPVFGDMDFKIGMSHAINRQEIVEIVHDGQGEIAQHAPLNDSPFYIDGMDTQYLEYDTDLANESLDKILPDKDAEGYRLGSDGNRFTIIFTVQNDLGFGTNYEQIAELLIGYWDEVGVEVQLNSIPGETHDEMKKKNLIEAIIFTGEGGAGITPLIDARYYVPMDFFGYFALGWYGWRVPDVTGETVAVEPPQWAKDARDLYDEAIAQPTYDGQVAKMREVIQVAKDRFYVMGISRNAPLYYPFDSNLGGIPDSWVDGWNEGATKICYPEQWFLKD